MKIFNRIKSFKTRLEKSFAFPQRWLGLSSRLDQKFFAKKPSEFNFYWYERNANRLIAIAKRKGYLK